MAPGRPKTPLFRIDGERGFCFLARREMHMQKIMVFKLGISQRSQQRPGDLTVENSAGREFLNFYPVKSALALARQGLVLSRSCTRPVNFYPFKFGWRLHKYP